MRSSELQASLELTVPSVLLPHGPKQELLSSLGLLGPSLLASSVPAGMLPRSCFLPGACLSLEAACTSPLLPCLLWPFHVRVSYVFNAPAVWCPPPALYSVCSCRVSHGLPPYQIGHLLPRLCDGTTPPLLRDHPRARFLLLPWLLVPSVGWSSAGRLCPQGALSLTPQGLPPPLPTGPLALSVCPRPG